MFEDCTSLTAAPELPAMDLLKDCYYEMFKGCTSLTAAPELPATNLAQQCYGYMFCGCTSLTAAPELPATNLVESCYNSMFDGCTSLTAAPELPATNLAQKCYYTMFDGCTLLTNAPALPATNLPYACYKGMFAGCTSLTDIPALNVAVVTNLCCKEMFKECTNLVVNTDGPGVEWCIPSGVKISSTADSTTKNYWATNMFAGTAGTITNSSVVTPGTKYYVASAPVEFRVTQPEHATFQAYANDAPVSVPFAGNYLADFKVTYTAKDGYVFPGGYKELTTNVTASAAVTTVTLTDDQLPVAVIKYLEPVYKTPGEPASGIDHWVTNSATRYTVVESSSAKVTWNTGWYVVTNDVTLSAGAACDGAVHLILADGAKLTAQGGMSQAGIRVMGASSLTIYAQTAGTGQLVAQGNTDAAGIGGDSDNDGMNITINGGTVTAKGNGLGAGIGGGRGGHGKNIRINGGTVKATAGQDCYNAIGDGAAD